MAKNSFFAMLGRMKYIARWGLMRSTLPENLSEHTLEVAYLVHALACIGNTRLGQSHDAGRLVLLAIYHDCSEILTGDMPTPVKYGNQALQKAYKDMEAGARSRLLALLPEDMRLEYHPLFEPNPDETLLLKAADKLSALIKCTQEQRAGNHEFDKAYIASLQALRALGLPEVEIFMCEFLPSYGLTLDELQEQEPNAKGETP